MASDVTRAMLEALRSADSGRRAAVTMISSSLAASATGVIEIEQTRKAMARSGRSRPRNRGGVCCMRINNSWTGLFNIQGACACLLYTSDAADERSSVDLGGRRI